MADLRLDEWIMLQLARLREEAERSKRREEAAKAVLSAATAAAKEGRVLSRQDIDAIEKPILNPEQPSQQQVRSSPFNHSHNYMYGMLHQECCKHGR